MVNIHGYVKKITLPWQLTWEVAKVFFYAQGTQANHDAPFDINTKPQSKVVYLRWFHLCRCRNEQLRYLRYGKISGNVVSIVYISGILSTGLLEWLSIFSILKPKKNK